MTVIDHRGVRYPDQLTASNVIWERDRDGFEIGFYSGEDIGAIVAGPAGTYSYRVGTWGGGRMIGFNEAATQEEARANVLRIFNLYLTINAAFAKTTA